MTLETDNTQKLTISRMDSAIAILNFWFGDANDPSGEYGQQRSVWFRKDPTFDAEIRQRFLADYENAAAGHYDSWQTEPRPCLALILLLDQWPRNLFRHQPQSFATDPAARAAAAYAIAHGYERTLLPVERLFLYLPFEHSEDPADQARSVQYFTALAQAAPELIDTLDYAHRHRDVITRFGRFPHRNAILGRINTPEEAEFLTQPGSRF